METYLNINDHLLLGGEKAALIEMITYIADAIELIPLEFRKTKHQYTNKD